jgi:hypothetical protein
MRSIISMVRVALLTISVAFAMVLTNGAVSFAGQVTVAHGVIADSISQRQFDFSLTAQSGAEPGIGSVDVVVFHDRSSSCSISGTRPVVGGNPDIKATCGTAYQQTVWLSSCRASLKFHAFQHSDHPFPTVLGPASVALRIWKTAENAAFIEIKSRTSAGLTIIRGPMTGEISWSDCP